MARKMVPMRPALVEVDGKEWNLIPLTAERWTA